MPPQPRNTNGTVKYVLCVYLFSYLSTYQIKQRKQIDPDQIHKVPVKAGHLNRGVIFGGVGLFDRFIQNNRKNDHPDQYMDAVQTGHGEIDTEKNMRVGPFHSGKGIIFPGQLSQVKFMTIFKIFDTQKYRSEQ